MEAWNDREVAYLRSISPLHGQTTFTRDLITGMNRTSQGALRNGKHTIGRNSF